MILREYCSSDCRETMELFYDTVHRVNRLDYTSEQVEAWAPADRDSAAWNDSFSGHFAVVAVQSEKIIGFADLTKDGYLDRLYIHADHQRQGVAFALLSCLEREARKRAISFIETHASVTAKPFFEKYGYETFREQSVVRKGQTLTNFVMRKNMAFSPLLFKVRQEREEDHPAVYQVIKRAFEEAEHADGNEQELVEALRSSNAFLPQLSLVAECAGEIIGYVLFTKVKINTAVELALAPLAVLPMYQRKGVGKALMERGHCIARKLGFHCCIVLGSEKYYPKAGYLPAGKFGISAPFEVPDQNFMVLKLCEDAVLPSGTVLYAEEFGL